MRDTVDASLHFVDVGTLVDGLTRVKRGERVQPASGVEVGALRHEARHGARNAARIQATRQRDADGHIGDQMALDHPVEQAGERRGVVSIRAIGCELWVDRRIPVALDAGDGAVADHHGVTGKQAIDAVKERVLAGVVNTKQQEPVQRLLVHRARRRRILQQRLDL